VYGRCLPAPIDIDSEEILNVLNKTEAELNAGQASVNIFMQAKEVQLHVISVCVCVVFLF
jgi:hypothetical protein